MNHAHSGNPSSHQITADPGESNPSGGLVELTIPLARDWRRLILTSAIGGVLAYGATYLVHPTFTASTTFLPPQQQGAAASALSSLGAIASLAGAGPIKTPSDQYVSFLGSTTIKDKLIDKFGLMAVYELKYRDVARLQLERNVAISAGKKDGLITVQVDDTDPKRAAAIANQFVEELRVLTASLALTEAQQRRVFFEKQLAATRQHLSLAQAALQDSGINPGTLKSEPKAAAEQYARLRAELTSAEIRLQVISANLADSSNEVRQQTAVVSALRSQLLRVEQSRPDNGPQGADYVSRYREFKYQETLFDLLARQYELARVDESRDGTLIQVIDTAQPPERKSKPRRAIVAVAGAVGVGLLFALFLLVRESYRSALRDPESAERIQRLRQAWRGR